jgi:hypothetical protein
LPCPLLLRYSFNSFRSRSSSWAFSAKTLIINFTSLCSY